MTRKITAEEIRAIAEGRMMLNVSNGVTVSRSMLAKVADEMDALSARCGEMERALRALLDCPDIADNDHKDEETHAAERTARAALSGSGDGGWRSVDTELPPFNTVVIVRYASGYDGGDVFAWGARLEDCDGWLWGLKVGYGASIRPSEDASWNGVDADDDYQVTHWMPLPAAPASVGGDHG